MNLSELPKITTDGKKRVGRGIGSGKGGHTSGRGQKGQKARNKLPMYFMGAAAGASLIKRLPYLRGKGKFKPVTTQSLVVNVEKLNVFEKGSVVTIETLAEKRLVDRDTAVVYGVKILGGGELNVAVVVSLPVTKQARNKIEKAGGSLGEKAVKVKEPKATKS